MKITRPYNNEIIIINDFGIPVENEMLIEAFKSANEEVWAKGNGNRPSCYFSKNAPSDQFNSEDVPTIVDSITDRAILAFEDITKEHLDYTRYGIITRNFKDGYFLHWDSEHDKTIKYGIVYYANDNFDGGEIFYPKFNIEYKPKAGDLIIHPATMEYMHGVRDVSSGVRYSMNMFAKTF
jgi:hypothetical protein